MAWTAPRTWAAGEEVTASLLNTHVRDNLKAIGDAAASYTPTLTNATVGNGTITGSYIQPGNLVVFRARFVLGSTSTVGTDPAISIPVAALASTSFWMMHGRLTDTGAANYDPVITGGTGSVGLFLKGTNGIYVAITATVPFTWTTGDVIEVRGAYEAA